MGHMGRETDSPLIELLAAFDPPKPPKVDPVQVLVDAGIREIVLVFDVSVPPAHDFRHHLPKPEELTNSQRLTWQDRTAAYIAEGMNQIDAETEAMAELVCNGKLYGDVRDPPSVE
jgi:hypothetical protein